jgi:hypothetical protein
LFNLDYICDALSLSQYLNSKNQTIGALLNSDQATLDEFDEILRQAGSILFVKDFQNSRFIWDKRKPVEHGKPYKDQALRSIKILIKNPELASKYGQIADILD